MPRIRPWLWVGALLAAALIAPAAGHAQSTGTIEGRVFNPTNGEFLERARLTIEGTTLEAFSDADGNYRLTNIPPGPARVTVFSTGFSPQTAEIPVSAGATARHDIQLIPFNKRELPADTGVVKLDPFAVNESKEMTAAAYAINEQRFAPNIKNVVSTDEFGYVAEGNVGEFLKFLPGVQMEYNSGFAYQASINGVPTDNVPISLDGFDVATSAGPNATGRATDLTMVSLNNLSRIEVTYSPTPESKGSALAGSVNMVPRSSFERTRPSFNYSTYLIMRDDTRDFNKTPGPYRTPARKVLPGFDFTYVRPVNDRFGFTLAGGVSKQYSEEPFSGMTWRGVSVATNGGAYPNTTPDRPYLTSYALRDGGRETTRYSFGGTVDYKLSPYDRVSLSIQYTYNYMFSTNHTLTFDVLRVNPGDFSTSFTHSTAGGGQIQTSSFGRDMRNHVYTPSIKWRHDGAVWKAEAGAGMSQSTNTDRNIDKGLFQNVTVRRSGVTMAFDDIFYLRPGTVTVTEGSTGQPVDPYHLDSYALISGASQQNDVVDRKRGAYANVRRDFYGRVPLSFKAGLDVSQAMRDLRGASRTYNYVGPDGRASTTPVGSDDGAGRFVNPTLVLRAAPWGFPTVPRPSPWLVWEEYRDHPNEFTYSEDSTYRNAVSRSKFVEETISSVYLRGDASFLERRLKFVGGVRGEQTNDKAEGPLTDPTLNFQRDASGKPILGPNGQPLTIASGIDASKLTYLDRGAKVDKEYLRWFPSINASYDIRPNLIARAAYYYSVGRPNLNQYAGGITLPNLELPNSSSNRITVNNVGIKAWSARSAQVRLEYYFQGVGQISVGAFRRDIENFFGGIVTRPTPAFLAIYGLSSDEYGEYDVSTQQNVPGLVRMEGTNVNYKQALTFLPSWARGVQIFANAAAQRATGDSSANFSGYVPRTASWGFSVTRQKYNFRANWNYRGRNRRTLIGSGGSIEPGTYNWGAKYLFLDLAAEYHFRKYASLYMNMRNVGDSPEDFKVIGPNTPKVAQFRSRIDYGSLWTIGLKGSF